MDLIDKLNSYRLGKLQLQDDAGVFSIVMNLPVVRELQNEVSRLKNQLSELQETGRFMQSSADTFCSMWHNFKILTKKE